MWSEEWVGASEGGMCDIGGGGVKRFVTESTRGCFVQIKIYIAVLTFLLDCTVLFQSWTCVRGILQPCPAYYLPHTLQNTQAGSGIRCEWSVRLQGRAGYRSQKSINRSKRCSRIPMHLAFNLEHSCPLLQPQSGTFQEGYFCADAILPV